MPIEPLTERYSADWLRWWPRELARLDQPFEMILGLRLTNKIETGQFLDAHDTMYWKSTQVTELIKAIHQGAVQADDWIVWHDAWNPCIEQIAYIRDVAGLKFKMAGLFHAGTYDAHDLLSRTPVSQWGPNAESAWLGCLDKIFVATKYHRELLLDRRSVPAPIEVTGFPFFADELEKYRLKWYERDKDIVVFPHRLAPEKQPEMFDAMAVMYAMRHPNTPSQWIKTKDVCKTKEDYYTLLGESKVAVSCALQETWGIAMLEAVACGCYPVVPNTLSYPETMTFSGLSRATHKYTTLESAVDSVYDLLVVAREEMPNRLGRWLYEAQAIDRMVQSMREA